MSDTLPRRIQLRRARGSRKPRDARVVTRATDFGNPYDFRNYGREESVRLFRERYDPMAKPMRCGKRVFPVLTEGHRQEIRGRDLACLCKPDEMCHADVLLEMADAPASNEELQP